MRTAMMLLLAVGFLEASSPANAQTPAPPEAMPAASRTVPSEPNLSLRKDLEGRREALMGRYAAWRVRADAFNTKYTNEQFDADSPQAREGAAEQAEISRMLRDYLRDSAAFAVDLGTLRLLPAEIPVARVVAGEIEMARQLHWSLEKQARLKASLASLVVDGDSNATDIQVRAAWAEIVARSQDGELSREAAGGEGLGFPGSGQQTDHNDCTIFALATATGRPYGFVAACANDLLRKGDWQPPDVRANPQKMIEEWGLNGQEVVFLAESLGTAEVVPSSEFPAILKGGRPVLVEVVPENGNVDDGHEVVLTKAFKHGDETWFVMTDSNHGPLRQLFLSSAELGILLKERGVAFKPEPGTVPQLLRNDGAP